MSDVIDDNEINTYILEILSGKRVIYFEPLNQYLCFNHPTAIQKLELDCLEKRLIQTYKSEGLTSEEDLTEDLREEFFSTDDQDELDEVESKIKAYDTIISKRIKGSVKYLEDYKKLSDMKKQKAKIESKKSNVLQLTAEYKAREDRYFELLPRNCTSTSGHQLWSSSKDYLENIKSLEVAYDLLNEYLRFYFGFEGSVLRKIARSPLWRNYYISSEKGILNLFNKNIEDLSLDQLNLVAWSNYYSDIYQLSPRDRPSQDVIENDEALDDFLEEFNRKTKAEMDLERSKSRNEKSNALKHQHSVVTPESSNYVSFHKQDMYSDPKEMSGGESSGTIDDGQKARDAKRKLARVNSNK